jgi:hypothetical protein
VASGEDVVELITGVNVVGRVSMATPVGVKLQVGIISVIPVWIDSVFKLLLVMISFFDKENCSAILASVSSAWTV